MKSKGLRGVEAGSTSICTVGENGKGLLYRGYDVVDLSKDCIFEEICYLLLYGIKIPLILLIDKSSSRHIMKKK